MSNLTQASRQLFARPPDERFESLPSLFQFCQEQRANSSSLKKPSADFQPVVKDGQLAVQLNGYAPCHLNDWSFTQFCSLAGAAKDTINRLQPRTAAVALTELLTDRISRESHLQALVHDGHFIRAINGERYTRLWNAELVAMLLEYATDFTPPQKGFNGATGLYAGEQDMFCFLIDPVSWVEIQGEAFAPGFFVWNSEVGRRTVGVSTFWFQAVCANHIVWDAVEVTEFTRRHTGQVGESLGEIRRIIELLVQKRDERKDGFATLIAKAMQTTYGHDAGEVVKFLDKAGFSRMLAQRAAELARGKGRFTLWTVVDALTQLAREHRFAGSRTTADQQASELLGLATT